MGRPTFEHQLDMLRQELLEMAAASEAMVADAVRALQERNVPLAESVIAADDRIDQLDIRIEAECMQIIALQQPVARDLRLVGTVLKVITDLERIGDHAVDIAKVARKLAAEPFPKPLVDIQRMSDSVRQMLNDAMAAFVTHDLDQVGRVVAADDEVDVLFHQMRDVLHAAMKRDAALVVQASYLLFVAHYLERIADHTVNIAERVYFIETGSLAQLALSHRSGS